MRLAILAPLVFVLACHAQQPVLQDLPATLPDSAEPARVVRVVDGDTLVVVFENAAGSDPPAVRVRLHGIDAPEDDQPYGEEARDELTRLAGERVHLMIHGTDRYRRTIASAYVAERNLQHHLVRTGAAWWADRYAPDDDELNRWQAEAAEERRGLWADEEPIAPWAWRRRDR